MLPREDGRIAKEDSKLLKEFRETAKEDSNLLKEDRGIAKEDDDLLREDGEIVKEAKSNDLIGIKGHRSVGGMRASLYNALDVKAAESLTQFMREFQKKHG